MALRAPQALTCPSEGHKKWTPGATAAFGGALALQGHASKLFPTPNEVDRSLRPVAEYGELLCFLQAQMVLGHSWTSDASPLSILCALLQWFLPYIVLLSGLLAVAIATLGPLEAFLALLPLPLLLPLQQLRCRAWNRQLLGAVDKEL